MQEPYYQHLPKETYNVLAVLSDEKKLLQKRESVRGKEKEYNMCQAITEMVEEGRKSGEETGGEQGIRFSQKLMQDRRYQDLDRALTDVKYREQLYLEYGII